QAFGPLPLSYLKFPAVRRLGWRIAAVTTVAALVVPELMSNKNATILALIVVIAIVGISVTLVTGLAGQLSLGQFGIAAVGAAGLPVAAWVPRNAWKGAVGRRLRAVPDNEEAARAFSIPATTVKLQAFVLSGVIAGLGGAVYFALLAQRGAVGYPIDLSTNAV